MEKDNLPKQTSIIVKATEWFADLALLNILWLFMSIPIITLIPATESLFYTIYKVYKKQKKHPLKVFIGYFKEHAFHSIKKNSYILIIYLLFFLNYVLISRAETLPEWMYLFTVALSILFVFFTVLCCYYFALSVQKNLDMKKRWLLAFYLAIKFFPRTIVFILLTGMLAMIIYLWPSLGLFFSFSLPVLFSTIVVEKDLDLLQQKVK